MGLKTLWIFLLILLSACAQVQPLGGGNKDESAPVPNFEKSSPKFAATEVRPREIRIPFNEYIKLVNPSSNISVTPELGTKPKFEVRGKELLVSLESAELLENTTYSFVFNKAIADVNEGNDTTFTFVFSTGASIDSLTYTAVVIDAESQMPVSNAMVELFSPSDTLNPYQNQPKYIAQTNKDGLATFEYLAEQALEVFAYWNKDGGKINGNSAIAFLSESVLIDTLQRRDTVFLFQPKTEEIRGRILKKEITMNGRIELVTNFDQKTDEIEITLENEKLALLVETTNRPDSTILWIQAKENSTYTLQIPFRDTLLSTKISTRKLTEITPKYKSNLFGDELELKDSLTLTFDLPIQSIDPEKVVVFQNDSIEISKDLNILNLRRLVLKPDESQNRIFIPPGAITLFNGSAYTDTIDIKFNRKSAKKYANLELVLENKPEHLILLRLYRGKDLAATQIVPKADTLLTFDLLPPGEYNIQVILDLNENGQFDTGDFVSRQQPEPVIWFRQSITLRANWDTSQPILFK